MENTLENKAKFFAQYWGQYVIIMPSISMFQKIHVHHVNLNHIQRCVLELTPLSQITDEDLLKCYHKACELAKYDNTMDFATFIEMAKHWINKEGIETLYKHSYNCDYLRSKAYAVPYNDLSVEEQIEYGWVKLKQH